MANEYPVEAVTQIKSPIDWAKQNPVGAQPTEQGGHPLIQSTRENMIAGTDEYARALEERFAQPNWLKVSAAFAKPQLGGFGASFGSAMDELGKQEEARRSVYPSVARMKAEVNAGQYGQAQRIVQLEKYNQKLKEKPDVSTWTPTEVQSIYQYDTGSEIAKALEKETGISSTRAGTRSTDVGTSIAGQKAAMENPGLVLKDPMFKGTLAENATPEQAKAYEQKLDAAKPQGISDEEWAAMGTTARAGAVAALAREKQMQGMSENQKSLTIAKSADTLLDDLSYLRTLAVDPKMAPLFTAFKDGDLISMYRAYLDKNPGNQGAAVEGMVNAAMERMKNKDEDTRAKFDKLAKGIARLEYNLRGSSVNPTNALQTLTEQSSPSLMNSRAGFVGILDQMGLQADRDIALHNFRVKSRVGENELFSDTEARKLRQQYRDMAEQLASKSSLDVKPNWYSATSGSSLGEQAASRTRQAQSQTQNQGSAQQPQDLLAALRAQRAARNQQSAP